METKFDRLLERCLQAVAQGDDVEDVVGRHPQHAERLRPLLQLALATGHLYRPIAPPPGDLVAGRARLLAAASEDRARAGAAVVPARPITHGKEKPKMKLIFASKLIGILMAALLATAAAGGGVAAAAGGSLPGELLYPAKLAVEDARLALAPSPAAQVALALDFADERTEEMQALVEAGEPLSEQIQARTRQQVRLALQQAAHTPEGEMPGLLAQIARRTQTQAGVMEQVRTQAPESAQAGLQQAQETFRWGQAEAEQGLQDGQSFRWRHGGGTQTPGTPQPTPAGAPAGAGPGGPGATPHGAQQGEQQQDRDRLQDPSGTPQGDGEPDRQQDRDCQQDGTCTPVGTPQGPQHGGGGGGSGQGATPTPAAPAPGGPGQGGYGGGQESTPPPQSGEGGQDGQGEPGYGPGPGPTCTPQTCTPQAEPVQGGHGEQGGQGGQSEQEHSSGSGNRP